MARYEIEAEHLRRLIKSGEYGVGATLPRISELSEERRVSAATVRRALEMLEDEGLVRVVRGTGAVVQPPAPPRRRIQRGLLVERDPARGYVFPAAAYAGEPWTAHGKPRASMEPAPQTVADVLGVTLGAKTLRRRRITSPVGEPPFQIVDTWLSPSAVADAPQVAEPSTGPGGYLDRLEFDGGHGPIQWQERTTARMPSSEEARLLTISRSLPVFELVLIGTSSRTGQAVEATIRVIPADRVEMVADLQRAESAQWPVEPVS
ncbi:GntR family transcriptional regulator [Streptomyces demainii]|uniref:GntR family transcriptional regulator n=1 Tax=Streptomyces demainii TaxID=588122 RepID=A0ABT9L6V2_9ACTN|nr:GntR family transcriptional regulator [Streptomyces demainii]MDP9616418.1 GntR family transcriptional regulator [Streptomyces demainii]